MRNSREICTRWSFVEYKLSFLFNNAVVKIDIGLWSINIWLGLWFDRGLGQSDYTREIFRGSAVPV